MSRRVAGWALVSLLAVGLLSAGFSPGSPELRWAFAAALAFGLLGLASPRQGVVWTAFAAAVAGGTAALGHAVPLCPWAALVVFWFGSGCLFRQLLAPSSAGSGEPVSRALWSLCGLWLLGSIAAALSARSLWALLRGLDLRIVNGRGTTDAEALAGDLNSLACALSGVVLYAILRGLDSPTARRALRGIVAGAAISGLAAFFQARGWLASPRLPYWRMAGRLQGLSSDPNALGVLVGLAFPVALAGGLRSSHRLRWWLAAAALAGGLAASGSRSGLLVALGGLVIVIALSARRSRVLAWVGGLAAAVLILVAIASDRRVGGLAERLVSIFNRDVPLVFRASARPILWRGAWEAWLQNPIAGVGWNAFSWQLPNLSPPTGAAMERYDNPGNFYLQVLAETGLVGMLFFLAFLAAAARAIAGSLRTDRSSPHILAGAAASLTAFAVALFFGSHLLAAEVSCAAFVLLAQFHGEERPSTRMGRGTLILLLAAAAAWGVSLGRTVRPAEAFRYSDGIGFYGPEPSPEGTFRWCGRRAVLRLRAGERKRIRVVFRNPFQESEKFRVCAGDAVLLSAEIARNRPVRLDLTGTSSGASILFLESSRSFRPSASGLSSDSRELSVQVFAEP